MSKISESRTLSSNNTASFTLDELRDFVKLLEEWDGARLIHVTVSKGDYNSSSASLKVTRSGLNE